jgi:hypothetical protein
MHEPDEQQIEEARQSFEMLPPRMNAAKIAYLNRTPFDGREVTFDELQ